MNFERHPRKAAHNLERHGVPFEEAATVFTDPPADVAPDLAHSREEDRFICLGASAQGRLLVVTLTERGDTIRLISARGATPKERRHYETYDPFT